MRYPDSQAQEGTVGRTVDFATKCPVLSDLGYCPFGWRCRFAGAHVQKVQPDGDGSKEMEGQGADAKQAGEWRISCDLKEREVREGWKLGETNWPDGSLLTKLRSDKVCLRTFRACGSCLRVGIVSTHHDIHHDDDVALREGSCRWQTRLILDRAKD